MKVIMAKKDVNTIVPTRIKAIVSDLSSAPLSGIIRATSINNVTNTTICEIILFSFFIPLFRLNNNRPKNNGIKDVIDPAPDKIYG